MNIEGGRGPLPRPAPNRAARQAAVKAHVAAVNSGNQRRQKAAEQHLTKMNLIPAQHSYTQPKVKGPKAPPQIYHGFQPSEQPLSHNVKPLKSGPVPILGGKPDHIARQQRQLGNIKKGLERENSQYDAMVNPLSHENLVFAKNQAWQDTGIPAIRNIGHDPVGGGLALAGLLPFGRVAELGRLGEAVKVGRTEEEAAQHVAEATSEAQAKGFGAVARKPHEPPRVPPGETTPQTGGELGKTVREGLKGAGTARNENALLYSTERAKRAAMAAEAMKVGGQEGYHAALGQLKGELPKVNFKGFTHLDQTTLDAMHTFIQQHPGLRTYDKITAMRSLSKAVSGKVPTQSEQKILQKVFGAETTKQVVESVGFWKKAGYHARDLLNVPRALMASFDLSAPFRQGLVAGTSYPGIFAKNFAPMLRSFKSEDVFHGVMEGIYDRPTFPLMQKAKLALTDIGDIPGEGAPALKEEQFNSNIAERLPGIGHGVRASDRAYVAFLNKTRADIFDRLVHQAAESGVDLHDQKQLEDIAKFVNSATGRGSLGALQAHAVTLNTLLFSPRLLASRFNFLNPVYYMRLSPFARQQALRAALRTVGTIGTVLYAAKMAGAKVNTDPTNADFAKIKIGNTRIDLAGGFQQPIRLLAQLAEGKITSSTTGKVIHLGPQGVGHLSRKDIAQRFFEGKLAPVPSLVNDLFAGTTFAGQPLSWKQEIESRMIPLLAQDANDLANQHGGLKNPAGLGAGAAGYGLGLFGIGLQTYSAKQKKKGSGKASYGSNGYGGSGGYGSGSGYGSSGGYGG